MASRTSPSIFVTGIRLPLTLHRPGCELPDGMTSSHSLKTISQKRRHGSERAMETWLSTGSYLNTVLQAAFTRTIEPAGFTLKLKTKHNRDFTYAMQFHPFSSSHCWLHSHTHSHTTDHGWHARYFTSGGGSLKVRVLHKDTSTNTIKSPTEGMDSTDWAAVAPI